MIVFLYIIILIIFIIIVLSLSYIEIQIENILIDGSEAVEKILENILKEKEPKNKLNVLNYISFNIKLRILFLNKIPIFTLKRNNYEIKEFLIKQYDKEMKKNKNKRKEDKKKAKNISKKLIQKIILKNTVLSIKLGTEDAAFTAIISSLINIGISIALPYVTDIEKMQNITYEVKPIYLNKNVFFLQFSGIIALKIVHIMKVICQKEEKVKNE